MIKAITIITSLILYTTLVTGQNKAKKNADDIWESIPVWTWKEPLTKNNAVQYFKSRESFRRKYREAGLKFWQTFPHDKRRFEWFFNTILNPPGYWENLNEGASIKADGRLSPILVNNNAAAKWEKIYPDLRIEYIENTLVDKATKDLFKRKELYAFLEPRLNSEYSKINKHSDSLLLRQLFIDAAATDTVEKISNTDHTYNPMRSIEMLFLYRDNFGWSLRDLENFVNSFVGPEVAFLNDWISSKRTLLKLQNSPFQLSGISLNGQNINLDQYKGKVVLVDFWATWCKVCIARMPRFIEIYERHKAEGFEVISVSIDNDNEKNRRRINDIENSLGIEWPTILIGGDGNWESGSENQAKEIFKKYGFVGVPQLLLLNKKGELVELNGKLLGNDVEELIVKQLRL